MFGLFAAPASRSTFVTILGSPCHAWLFALLVSKAAIAETWFYPEVYHESLIKNAWNYYDVDVVQRREFDVTIVSTDWDQYCSLRPC